MNFYAALQSNPDQLHSTISSMGANSTSYYRHRRTNPKKLGKFDRAVRFGFLNRHCFNGIYRTNRAGEFNVPFGGEKKRHVVPPVTDFRKCSLALRGAQLRSSDFEETLKSIKSGDFAYLDPPYAVANRRVFRQYDSASFGLEDVERLSRTLRKIDSKGAAFVVSYADCAEARRIFREWSPRRVLTRRQIAGFASARRHSFELIATNLEHP